ncbi:glycosyltransferase [Burkholderia pseudomultivorans]|uniref:glycosyltransferase n=1 Tax=Burkholderia pseudomultivorans TaxID=1207504 RepID=UPI00075EA44B|nr:glycosyltransferase [Burkholderia pseudomultivorans]KWF08356.1 glycosyl transferase [Burkholderia pseudomultivorans]
MKLVIATYGTEGDTRPLAALGRALIDAGHEVLLLADRATLGSAAAAGVPAAALSGDIRRAIAPDGALSDAVRGRGGFNDTSKALAAIANANTAAWMREVADASAGCDAIVVSGLVSFVGLSVAEYRRVPAIGAGMIPITPTAAFASPFLPPRKVPRWLNRASHRCVNALLWQAFRRATNAARAGVCGLPPRRRVWTDHPMLYGVSPALLPDVGDWPDHARACGQWRVAAAPQWTPPPALAAFLDAGEPPVYVGFGSMGGFDRGALAAALATALDGRRALFYPGWSGIDAALLPPQVCVIGDTPHDWLLPRTSLAIHHGGSGTAHSAARAGIPSVVVPFAGDQFFWADRLQRLGVADQVAGRRLQAAALARAIAFAERNDTRARATELGARIAREDGATCAVAAIERWVRVGVR